MAVKVLDSPVAATDTGLNFPVMVGPDRITYSITYDALTDLDPSLAGGDWEDMFKSHLHTVGEIIDALLAQGANTRVITTADLPQ